MNYHSDDNHFAMGAQLVADGYTPYVDFPYFQMPYASYIYGAILRTELSVYKYLVLRLTNLAFCFASIALVYVICLRLTRSRGVAMAGILLFSSSEFAKLAAGQLNSYAIANFFAVLAFAALTVLNQSPIKRAFLSGLFLGVAIASKLYYAFLLPPMLVFALALIQPVTYRSALRTGLLWFFGLAIALAPVGLIATINPAAFWFDNYGYHILNSKYRELSQSGDGMTIPAKFKFLAQMLGNPTYLSIGILGVTMFSYAGRRATKLDVNDIEFNDRILLVATGSFAFMLATAMIPRPLWPSYFLAPLPFAIATLACLYRFGSRAEKFRQEQWDLRMINVAIFVALLSIPSDLYLLKKAINIDAWSTIAIHKHGQRIRELVVGRGHDDQVLTFEGLYAIEGGIPFYRQMAGATFAYRVGDLMTDQLRAQSNITSKVNIDAMLDADPPIAILVSSRFDRFNSEILRYATTNNYRETDIDMPDHRLFVYADRKD